MQIRARAARKGTTRRYSPPTQVISSKRLRNRDITNLPSTDSGSKRKGKQRSVEESTNASVQITTPNHGLYSVPEEEDEGLGEEITEVQAEHLDENDIVNEINQEREWTMGLDPQGNSTSQLQAPVQQNSPMEHEQVQAAIDSTPLTQDFAAAVLAVAAASSEGGIMEQAEYSTSLDWHSLDIQCNNSRRLPGSLLGAIDKKSSELHDFMCSMAQKYNIRPSNIKRHFWSHPDIGKCGNNFNDYQRFKSEQDRDSIAPKPCVSDLVKQRAEEYQQMMSCTSGTRAETEDSEYYNYMEWKRTHPHRSLLQQIRSANPPSRSYKSIVEQVENVVSCECGCEVSVVCHSNHLTF